MSTEQQAEEIRARMRADMTKTLDRNGFTAADPEWVEILLNDLVADGMFPVEHILTKVDWHE